MKRTPNQGPRGPRIRGRGGAAAPRFPAASHGSAAAAVVRARGTVTRILAGVVLLGWGSGLISCAYYNTFYLARKYYEKGTEGLPYPVDETKLESLPHFNKSIEYSKKLIAQYPNDKWVDDAYLLWARALLGKNDPRESVKLLAEFDALFPKSPLKHEATFYLGVAHRQARKNSEALVRLDQFLAAAPKHELVPYALLERVRALMAVDRPGEAAEAAAELLQRFPKSKLTDQARVTRAEALFAQGEYDRARQDFRGLGQRSKSDQQRLDFLLREADCLEAARKYDEELELLHDALAHETEPTRADTARVRLGVPGTQPGVAAQTPSAQAYGRLLIRIGTVHLLAGRLDEALRSYQRVSEDYVRTPLGAEAQYRIGYAYETVADDFERARTEYGRVKEHGQGTTFANQATQRLSSLDRLAQFRSAGGDSVEKKAEAGFLLAEVYLFQLDKPDRALEEYRRIAEEFAGTPIAAKAINAQGWVLSRKLDRPAQAESLFWSVVREFPATEAQLAARDYLEMEGVAVPSELIKMPERKLAAVDSVSPGLEPATRMGTPDVAASVDSTSRLGMRPPGALRGLFSGHSGVPARGSGPPGGADPEMARPPAAGDSSGRDTTRSVQPASPDSGANAPPPGESAPEAPADSTGEAR